MTKRRNIGIFLAIIGLLSIAIYAVFNSRLLIAGPKIEIESPYNNQIFTESIIEVKGKTANTSFISLNDHPIFIDEEGDFSEKLLLSPGTSIIKMYANDRFGREETKLIRVKLEGENIEVIAPIQSQEEIETESASSTPQ